MERNSLMRLVKTLRYNSPSKRQIRRLAGRPKSLTNPEAAIINAPVEPIKYSTKETAPFAVTRSMPGKNLPVYSEYRNGGSRRLTIVRRIEGDVDEMANELGKVCIGSNIEIHNGSIHVQGDRSKEIVNWLKELGF